MLIGFGCGILLGGFALAGDLWSPAAGNLASNLGPFAVFSALVGRFAPNRFAAVLRTTLMLEIMCVVYYAWHATSVLGVLAGLLAWGTISLLGGPVLGLLGHATRRRDRWGIWATAGLTGLLIGESVRILVSWITDRVTIGMWPVLVFDIAAAGVIIACMRSDRRPTMALATVPCIALGYLMTALLR